MIFLKEGGSKMKNKDRIIFEWDGGPIEPCSKETQDEINEYEKNHIDHPEFYADYDDDESDELKHS